jgi:hypothetical protein
MALIYRTNSLNARTKGKKANPPAKVPKFPKNAIRNEDGSLKTIGTPYNATLGTAHVDNRFNETFGVDPRTLRRSQPMPSLNQWVTEALTAIAYKITKAHNLTNDIVLPLKGWKRTRQRIGFRDKEAPTQILRDAAVMFTKLRNYYMNDETSLIIDCLEESDQLWLNVSVPTLCWYLLLRWTFSRRALTYCCRFLSLSRDFCRPYQRYYSVVIPIYISIK